MQPIDICHAWAITVSGLGALLGLAADMLIGGDFFVAATVAGLVLCRKERP